MLIKIYSFLFTIAMILGLVYYAHDYYQSTQVKMEEMKAKQAQYEVTLQTTQNVIQELEQQNQIIQKRTLELQENLAKAEEYQDELRNKIHDHDLTNLSSKKPTLIEKRINDATSEIFKELETITAHPSIVIE